MTIKPNEIFDNYVQAAKLKNASLRYRFTRDILAEVEHLVEKFDYEIQMIIRDIAAQAPDSAAHDDGKMPGEEYALNDPALSGSIYGLDQDGETSFPSLEQNADLDPSQPLWFKNLFKKIAVQCHPDKVINRGLSARETHFMLANYDLAREALDDADKPQMVCVGIDLKVVGELGADHSADLLNNTSTELESKVEALKGTVSWVWGAADTNIALKTKLLRNVFSQLYGVPLSEKNAHDSICKFYDKVVELPPEFHKVRRVSGRHPGPHLRNRRKKNG